jgi:hypothetical protein
VVEPADHSRRLHGRDTFRRLPRNASASPATCSTNGLSHLVDEGVFERVAYNEHPPATTTSSPNKAATCGQWSSRFGSGATAGGLQTGPPLQLLHRECGHIAEARPCAAHTVTRPSARPTSVRSQRPAICRRSPL